MSSHFVDTLLADEEIKKSVNTGAKGNGRTALMLAVSANAEDNVVSLIKHGADVNWESGGTTAVELARDKGMEHLIPIMNAAEAGGEL